MQPPFQILDEVVFHMFIYKKFFFYRFNTVTPTITRSQFLRARRTHPWNPVCSGDTVPRDTGVVRGEAICDTPEPGLW